MDKELVYELPGMLNMTGESLANWTNLIVLVNQTVFRFQFQPLSPEVVAKIQNIADTIMQDILSKGEGISFYGDGKDYIIHRVEVRATGNKLELMPLWEVKR